MFYELRFYNLEQGRSEDMIDRMRLDLTRIFTRNQVPIVGAWMVESGPDLPQLSYLTAHESPQTAATSWAGFYADPDWHETLERTNAGSDLVLGGQIINLAPVPQISPSDTVYETEDALADDVLYLRIAPGHLADAAELFETKLAPVLRDAGAGVLGALNVKSGLTLTTLVIYLRWSDTQARRRGGMLLDSSAALRDTTLIREMVRTPLHPLSGLCAKPGLVDCCIALSQDQPESS